MRNLDRRAFLAAVGAGAAGLLARTPLPALAQTTGEAQGALPRLDPIPANEAGLPRLQAEPWLQIDPGNVFLKGMAFDQQNNLLLVAAYASGPNTSLAARVDRAILRVTPDKLISTVVRKHGPRFCDIALDKSERIFIACLTGELFAVEPDGSQFTAIRARVDGRPEALSDLTFDSHGALYVTDFIGKAGDPQGGIYRYAADFATVARFGPPLVSPNGIAFTRDEDALWVSCSFDKKLLRLTLSPDRSTVAGIGASYNLNGPGGDGIRIDQKGNVYLAMNFQGRLLVFDAGGRPVATVLMPGREHGALLGTTNLAFKPGTDEAYACASGERGGTWIYRFKGLAAGLPLYSHQ